jgi:hypothetical protein
MTMITQETCAAIYAAHREILSGEKLLADMKAERERIGFDGDKHAPTLKDHFGRVRLDQVRGKIIASSITACVPNRHMWIGLNDLSGILASATRGSWGPPRWRQFLTHLAVAGRVAASTQNQAKSALLFLYREVLGCELPWLDNVERPRRPSAAGGADARRGPWPCCRAWRARTG